MGGDFVQSHGRAFLAHRLRRSSELVVGQVGEALRQMQLSVPTRGASMLLLIDQRAPIGVVEISRRLRLSHPLIVRMAQRFAALGLAEAEKDPLDARRKQLVPTAKGRVEAEALRRLNERLAAAFGQLFAEIDCDLIATLDRLDAALQAVSMEERLTTSNPEEKS
jgi:DNA-binding MarR family transcriptional regulator